MGIILASILTFFINKEDGNKYLACLLMIYLSFMWVVYETKIATFDDYILIYTTLNIILCGSVLFLVSKTLWHRVSALSVVVPQLLYLVILHKPYLLSIQIPHWYLFNVDTYFIYGVFLLSYETSFIKDIKGMKLKDKLLNLSVVYCLIMF